MEEAPWSILADVRSCKWLVLRLPAPSMLFIRMNSYFCRIPEAETGYPYGMVPQRYINPSHLVKPYTVRDKYYPLFGLLDDVDLNDGEFWQQVGKCQQTRMKAR